MIWDFVYGVVAVVILMAFLIISVMVLVYVERRFSALFQSRLGPNRVGFEGCLQVVNDAIKLLQKESVMHKTTDRFFFRIAPALAVGVPVAAFVTIPFADNFYIMDLKLGIFVIFALLGYSSVAVLCAGYASRNRYSLIGAVRAGAQLVSYETPMILSVLAIICLTDSTNLREIVFFQKNHGWLFLLSPVSFIIFFICSLAECNRAPFDLWPAFIPNTPVFVFPCSFSVSMWLCYWPVFLMLCCFSGAGCRFSVWVFCRFLQLSGFF
jgi:NADH-quinone oxidoreductase subunit H